MAESNTRNMKLREYQRELLEAAKEKNIIVCLGTGTGKTFISIKLIEYLARRDNIAQSFSQDGAKRTFFLVNSVPLVFQQAEAIEKCTALKVKPFCGEMGVDFWSKQDWLVHFEANNVLVMTHQIYLDLLQHGKLKLSQANLLIFDECHHAAKKHPFKKIMDRFADFPQQDHPRILGLTASVVGKKVKPFQISDEIKKLERTLRCVCKTARNSNIVEKYGAKPTEHLQSYPSSSHLDSVAKYLEDEFRNVLLPLQTFLGNIKVLRRLSGSEEVIEKELVIVKGAVRECLSALDDIGIWAAYEVSKMLLGDLEKRNKRVSSAGLSSDTNIACLLLQTTMTSLRELAWKYSEFQIANLKNEEEIQQEYLKPKVKELLKLFLETEGNICSIVFVQRRYAACVISKLINVLSSESSYCHLKSDFVTGHGSELWGISETEMKYNEQNKKLVSFRKGDFNVLVGTSVVEEGVDIPKCNLVVMFDFPQNYRAFVQSRGRGRAKGARYVLLVEKSEYSEARHQQEQYNSVDAELTKLCQRDRDAPTEEEIDDEINQYPLENYFTEKNARLDMGSSVSLLYRYCSKLPCDRFTRLKPIFTKHVIDDEFQYTLQMPGNSRVTEIITGERMKSLQEAKQAVAHKMCIMLHKNGALDDLLLPEESSSESETEDEVDGPSSQPKTGTKKRQRTYVVKTSLELYGKFERNKQLHLYSINMEFVEVWKDVKKNLWDRKNVLLGIITEKELPQFPSFFLYNEIGKLEVSLGRCDCVATITSKERDIIDWFHCFIFKETLEFKLGTLANNGCRLVFVRNVGSQLCIDFSEMRSLHEKVSKSDEKFAPDTDLLDSVVIQSYLKKPGHNMVVSVTDDTPLSPFPSQEKAKTFEQYHEDKYHSKIKDLSQPLIKVIHHSRKIDCRSGKIYRDISRPQKSSRRNENICLIPEKLKFRTSPQSLTLRALFIPAILYRVDNFISAGYLQDCICKQTIPILESAGETSTPRSQQKKIKFSFPKEENSKKDHELPSTLSKYFHSFDESKLVPLVELTKALTCASSADDFDLERLEMLGDSFLKMAVSIHVYWHKDHKDEGKLTKYRIKQISNKNLFKLAEKRDLPGYVKHSKFSKETWVPPGFNASCTENDNVSSDYDSDDVTDGVTSTNALMQQQIPDKSIADSMEALIGAHLINCGYIGAMKFMTWLGVDVFCSKISEEEQPTNGRRRKSPILQPPSKYANYPMPTLDIPPDEAKLRYEEILAQQTGEMKEFEKKIGYTFKNKVLLLEAFTHPTFSDNTITGSYQRLEFLGDAILDFLVTQHIYNNDANLQPGQLTDLRSALVNNNIFAVIAVENDYHKYLKEYSPPLFNTIRYFVEAVQEFQDNLDKKVNPDPYVVAVQSNSSDVECIEAPKPLGDVFESIAGAIFLDSGLDIREVWRVCYPMLQKFIDEYSKNVPKNPVRRVKEIDESAEFGSAEIKEEGRISCVLTFKGKEYEGVGRNKHNAKLSAAYKALTKTNLYNN